MHPEALARDIVSTLRGAGHQAWLVGGCVRDLLLGVPPKDFDVATDARPERIVELFPHAGLVGAHFGVVLVRRDSACVEVATFRSDRDYADGRRPAGVRFETSPQQDALRRDFTINGLMMDPASGEVLDCCGGRADWSPSGAGHRRPRPRFREDHLRLLRAVRFAARLGFQSNRPPSKPSAATTPPSCAFPPSACATSWCASSPRAARAADSNCSTRPACWPISCPKWPP